MKQAREAIREVRAQFLAFCLRRVFHESERVILLILLSCAEEERAWQMGVDRRWEGRR